MNTPPVTDEIYSVSYAGGSSGQFIRSMIIYMLRNDDAVIDFGDGSSHVYSRHYTVKRLRLPLQGYNIFVGDRFKTIQKNATIEDLPLVLAGGLDFMDPTLYSLFPNFKCVLVKVDMDDALITGANHYYKRLVFKDQIDVSYYETYNRCVESGTLRSGVSTISELNSNEMRVLLETRGKEDLVGYISEMEHRLSNWPEDQDDKLFIINFKDITDNPKQVIKILEEITNMKMSDAANEQYYRYVDRQIEFRKEYGLE